ncbi:HAD family hydrolase [Lachnospira multipara]|jgi:phosphoglycolate phosphatase-like HAD superfamily hydrolase|uniref:HAD family hydrolase n=1 Tax=Lachnospira multipara TaxID=28051 RepID=UPI000486C03C|nr:HAD hydrolase-like protein [Lachnospira multipara]
MVNLSEFKKNKDFLICVDSDGCAMDTMDIKHFNCFGPCMVAEWNLSKWNDEILVRWNEINLYSMTRGINRFAGLAKALDEINKKYCEIPYIDEFLSWTETAAELSNRAVEKMFKDTGCPIFSKALNWSNAVNKSINELDDSLKKPFDNVLEGLKMAHTVADIAVVSSANREAVVEEWQRFKLTDYVDCLCCQDSGTKALCIEKLKSLGYENDHILMVGDAPGDMAAAKSNDVYFYPILVRHEKESWEELKTKGISKLTELDYKEYGQVKEQEFIDNLK